MQTVNSSMREEFGKRTIHEVVSGEREQIMTVLREKTDLDARKIGVQVLDVRLKRVDFPLEISDSVYRRMDAERKRVANELRASGAADGEKIKADADKQREVGLAMMLVIEGLLPFLLPELWRETFRKLVLLTDGQLRFVGIVAMLSGLLLLYLV